MKGLLYLVWIALTGRWALLSGLLKMWYHIERDSLACNAEICFLYKVLVAASEVREVIERR